MEINLAGIFPPQQYGNKLIKLKITGKKHYQIKNGNADKTNNLFYSNRQIYYFLKQFIKK